MMFCPFCKVEHGVERVSMRIESDILYITYKCSVTKETFEVSAMETLS